MGKLRRELARFQECTNGWLWNRRPGVDQSAEELLEADIARRHRMSSFPFISGDTFRSMCSHVIDETKRSLQPIGEGSLIFVAAKYVTHFLDLAGGLPNKSHFESATILIHNGDGLPDIHLMAKLVDDFGKVWSVNPSPEMERIGVGALPIGLENLHWGRSGLLKYFPLASDAWALPAVEDREHLVFASFSEETNFEVRHPLRNIIKDQGVKWREPDGDMKGYLNDLRNSVFVLSPQGNGRDCHRTWEALYLGAIPVVSKGSLGRELVTDLPILEVAEWKDFLHLPEPTLLSIASNLLKRSRAMGYMPFWCNRLARTGAYEG